MKIIILNYEYPPLGGGAANATKYILKNLSKYKNLEIDLVTSSINKFKIEKPYNNITIHYLDIKKNKKNIHTQSNKDLLTYSKKAYSYSKKLIKQNNYDFIHAFFGIPCGFIAQKLKLPYIVSLRGSDVPFYSDKYKLLDKLFFKRLSKNIWKNAKFVIANSNGLKQLANNTAPNQHIGVIFNGIDTTEFKPKKNSLKHNKNNKLKILCVGRLIERKGFSYVIHAIKPISDKVSLTFIGDGPLKQELKIQSKGLDINFLGIVEHDKLASIYPKYDVFILPSFNEGMSNTVLEAMASGLAVIVSDTGGTLELINKNGFIVKIKNSDDITKYLNMYLNNKTLLEKHKLKSRQLAKNLSWNSVASEYYEIYKNMK